MDMCTTTGTPVWKCRCVNCRQVRVGWANEEPEAKQYTGFAPALSTTQCAELRKAMEEYEVSEARLDGATLNTGSVIMRAARLAFEREMEEPVPAGTARLWNLAKENVVALQIAGWPTLGIGNQTLKAHMDEAQRLEDLVVGEWNRSEEVTDPDTLAAVRAVWHKHHSNKAWDDGVPVRHVNRDMADAVFQVGYDHETAVVWCVVENEVLKLLNRMRQSRDADWKEIRIPSVLAAVEALHHREFSCSIPEGVAVENNKHNKLFRVGSWQVTKQLVRMQVDRTRGQHLVYGRLVVDSPFAAAVLRLFGHCHVGPVSDDVDIWKNEHSDIFTVTRGGYLVWTITTEAVQEEIDRRSATGDIAVARDHFSFSGQPLPNMVWADADESDLPQAINCPCVTVPVIKPEHDFEMTFERHCKGLINGIEASFHIEGKAMYIEFPGNHRIRVNL